MEALGFVEGTTVTTSVVFIGSGASVVVMDKVCLEL
jgi:hypothetical protein